MIDDPYWVRNLDLKITLPDDEELKLLSSWMNKHFGNSGLFPNGNPRWEIFATSNFASNNVCIRVYTNGDLLKVKLRWGIYISNC